MSSFSKLIITCLLLEMLFYFSISNIIAHDNSLSMIKIIADGAPRELQVEVFEDIKYIEDNNDRGIVKLNISWLPPETLSWNPTSYSILMNSIVNDTDNSIISCPDESIFYTTWNKSHLNVQLPENEIFSDAPELTIRPKCTYEIQVFANPRINANSNVAKLRVTIPNCIGNSCQCESAIKLFSLTKINIKLLNSHNILIEWNDDSIDYLNITSYIIRYSVPILISKNGLPVYNTSVIANVPANTSFYLLSVKSIDPSLITLEDKISIAAVDVHGCSGNATEFLIKRSTEIGIIASAKRYERPILIATFLGFVILLLGIIGFLWKRSVKKYQLITSNHTLSRQTISEINKQSHWIVSTLKEHNVIYIPQTIEARESDDDYEISYSRLSIVSELGKGQFAKVYLGHLDGLGNFPVAVKMSNNSCLFNESEARKQLLNEIITLKRAGSHENLIKLIGYCTQPETPVCIVLEYLQGGDLLAYLHRLRDKQNISDEYLTPTQTIKFDDKSMLNWIHTMYDTYSISSSIISNKHTTCIHPYVNVHKNNNNNDTDNKLVFSTSNGKIEYDRFIHFVMNIIQGMEHLEQHNIVHRDLAARNILITSNLSLKISDFGLSRDSVYVIGQNGSGTRRLPIRWMAPETLRDRLFTSKSDVWSFAIVLWEIGTLGAFPYSEISDDELFKYIVDNEGRLKQPDSIKNEFYDLMQICWSSRPENRPTFAQIRSLIINFNKNKNSFIVNNSCYNFLSALDDISR